MLIRPLFLLLFVVSLRVAAQPLRLETALGRPILPANQPLAEVQVYTASHVKSMSLVGQRSTVGAGERNCCDNTS